MKTISKVAFKELAEDIMGEATHEYTNEVDGTLGTVWEGNGRYVYGLSQGHRCRAGNRPVDGRAENPRGAA